MRRLQEAGVDVAGAEGEERLVIRHWEDTYLQDGHFDQHRQISLFERVLLEGKKQGYPVTRFVAGTEWALLDRPGVHDLIEYECRINDMFSKYDDPVCCTYDLSKFSASVIMDAMRVHPAVIIGGIYQENPFYVPPDEFLRELREVARPPRYHRSRIPPGMGRCIWSSSASGTTGRTGCWLRARGRRAFPAKQTVCSSPWAPTRRLRCSSTNAPRRRCARARNGSVSW